MEFKIMKNLLLSIGSGALAFLFMYLIGSFYSTTFNISLWTSDCRVIISVFGTMFFLGAFWFTYLENSIS